MISNDIKDHKIKEVFLYLQPKHLKRRKNMKFDYKNVGKEIGWDFGKMKHSVEQDCTYYYYHKVVEYISPKTVMLDIGCGSGLIAIMAAQRCNAQITGIEIDRNASLQARENVADSPWSERIEIINGDFLEYKNDKKRFDTIVCNPPYFVNSLKCDKSSRTLARHSDSLNCNDFFAKCAEVSTADSTVSIIIPCDIAEEWQSAAEKNGFRHAAQSFVQAAAAKSRTLG